MNRKKLVNALERIATAEGYHFYSAEEQLVPQTVKHYPAAYLPPPVFSSMEGENHGSIIYSVTLHTLAEGAKQSPADRSTRRCIQEEALLNIFTTLSKEPFVAEVEKLKIRHSTPTIAARGEVVSTASADVITFF